MVSVEGKPRGDTETRSTMKLVRSFAAAAALAAAFACVSKNAAAAPAGYQSMGKDYSKSVSSGDFGAGFQVYAKAEDKDYDQLCASTSPTTQCAGKPGLLGTICQMVWKPMNQMYCSQHGVGISAAGAAGADVTLFGKDLDLLDLKASAAAEPSGAYAQYGIYVGGKKVQGYSVSSSFSKDAELASMTLVSASSTFMLGPVPLNVEASAVGSLGINFAMNVGTSQVSGSAGPYASVDGVFSAGLGVTGLSAGIEGDLLLVKVSTPATAGIAYSGAKTFTYNAGLDLQIQALDGSISLYGKAGPYKATWEIVSWTGLSYTKNLGSTSGTFSL